MYNHNSLDRNHLRRPVITAKSKESISLTFKDGKRCLRTQEHLQCNMHFGAVPSSLVLTPIIYYLRTNYFPNAYLLVNAPICVIYFCDENSLRNGGI